MFPIALHVIKLSLSQATDPGEIVQLFARSSRPVMRQLTSVGCGGRQTHTHAALFQVTSTRCDRHGRRKTTFDVQKNTANYKIYVIFCGPAISASRGGPHRHRPECHLYTCLEADLTVLANIFCLSNAILCTGQNIKSLAACVCFCVRVRTGGRISRKR